MSKEEITQEDKNYLWSLMPRWDSTYFGTLSREGDLKVHNKVIQILNQNKDE